MTDAAPPRSALARAILIVTSGNFLEMYDFMVFGYYAGAIGLTYFPGGDEYAGAMKSFALFGAAFLMRPLGALILGTLIDRVGRRHGLLITLGLMAIGTLTIALTPGYARIGLAAPLIVLLGRVIQGLSAGVEIGGVSVYLAEIAGPKNRGFVVSWQSASQQLAVILAAGIGVALSLWLGKTALEAWGWRVPFIAGCVLIPFLFVIRGQLKETTAFLEREERPNAAQILASVGRNWVVVTLGAMMATLTTVSFYLITAYAPTYGAAVLHLSLTSAFVVTLCVGVSNFALLPIAGAVADRIGRRPLLLAAAAVTLISAYPMLRWLVAAPSFGALLAVELWFSALFAAYNGAMVVHLTEVMPRAVRTAGFSLAYSLATGVFGGFTPLVCTWLIQQTGDKAAPGVWLSGAAVLGLAGALGLWARERTRSR